MCEMIGKLWNCFEGFINKCFINKKWFYTQCLIQNSINLESYFGFCQIIKKYV